MNKELEETVNYFKKRMDICLENAEICDENDFDEEATCLRKEQMLIENILNYIENSIPKQLVEDKIEELNNPNEDFKKWASKYNWYEDRRIGAIEVLSELLEGK